MTSILAHILLFIGAAFMLVAGLGVLRFPDLLSRMHAVSKATSLGLAFMLLALAVAFPSVAVVGKVVGIILFIVLTVPTASHLIARAAKFRIPSNRGNRKSYGN